MINKESRLVVSFKEKNSYLSRKGNYETADIKVINPFGIDSKTKESTEKVLTKTPMRVINEPVLNYATRNLNLSYAFLEMALNLDDKCKSQRPERPRKHGTKKDWDLYNRWNIMSEKEKIRIKLLEYAHDINCELISFDILN